MLRIVLLSMLVGISGFSCQSDKPKNSFTDSSKKAWLKASEVTIQTTSEKPRPVSLDTAMTFIENYQDLVDQTPVPDGFDPSGNPKTRPLRKLLHSGLCDTCRTTVYPSYSILITDLEKIIKQTGKSPTHLRIYPAIRIGIRGEKYYTIVLVAADSKGDAVLNNRNRRSATAQENQIWEYINPCPPPKGCKNIQ